LKQRQPLKIRRLLILRTLKVMVVEVKEDMKTVKSNSVNKTSVAEDKVGVVEVEAEEVSQATRS